MLLYLTAPSVAKCT